MPGPMNSVVVYQHSESNKSIRDSFSKLLKDYHITNFSHCRIEDGSAIPGSHVFSVD